MKRVLLVSLVCFFHVVDAYGDGSSVTLACDGGDNTTYINSVLDAVGGAADGGEVIIPPGTCLISPKPEGTQSADDFLRLYSNLTIRGVGRKSILKVKDGAGGYGRIFSSAAAVTELSNVVIKDFTIDQNTTVTSQCILPLCSPTNATQCRYVIAPFVDTRGITVSGMFFDPTDTPNTIFVTNASPTGTGDLQATVTNNYFNFVKCQGLLGQGYDVSTVLMEGSQQVITGNTFSSPTLDQGAFAAIETLGGRNVIAGNTFKNYATAVLVLPTYYACPSYPTSGCPLQLKPSGNTIVANNSVTCAQSAITIWPTTDVTLRNVSITGNTLHICNADRSPRAFHTFKGYSGIQTVWEEGLNKRGYKGDVDGLTINNNVITMQKEDRAYDPSYDDYQNTAGILLRQFGNPTNVLIKGNIIKDAPVSGIRLGAAEPPHPSAQRVRIVDNIIVDAGNNGSIPEVYRHAIGLFDTVADVDIARNMIYDTAARGDFTNLWGRYALYLQPGPSSTNVRTSQNTVRVNSTSSGVLLRSVQGSDSIKDTTNANDVLVSSPPTGTLAVDFMSFTQYITTITGTGSLIVSAPGDDGTSAQWTVGQVVTFRFLCAAAACSVSFNARYSTTGNLAIGNAQGRAITFQVENSFASGATHNFFELYRSQGGVPNQ